MKYSEHLHNRGLRPWHHCWVDNSLEIATFPLYGWCNKLVGYQRYNWRGTKKTRSNHLKKEARYFAWVSSAYVNEAVYGWDNLYGYGPLFVTEGIWDAISIGNVWFDCLAIMTATPSRELVQYIHYRINRPIIAVCDNDKAGSALACAADFAITTPEGYKDVNEMPLDILRDFLLSAVSRLL